MVDLSEIKRAFPKWVHSSLSVKDYRYSEATLVGTFVLK